MYCIDGIRTLKNCKPTLKAVVKQISKKNANRNFGADLAHSYKGYSFMGEGGTGAPALVAAQA